MTKVKSYFNPPFLFKNKHLSTVIPALLRKIKGVYYQRIRINTPDKDFLDLDFSGTGSKEIIIVLHGLEGNTRKSYVTGIVRTFNKAGIDALAVNLRGCSNDDNNNFYSYHSGKTDDLDLVLNYLTDNYDFEKIYLAGFSLGGNIVLKYAGEQGADINHRIKAAVGISVPCDLRATSYNFLKKDNFLYQYRFIRSLRKKALNKIKRFPEYQYLEKEIKACRNFFDFDNLITAPFNGFYNAEDYWKKCSSKQYIGSIKIPTLLINALDDPFLTQESYPYTEAGENPFFNIETPKYGGHVGFVNRLAINKVLWHEKRVLDFVKNAGNN
jgi:predicted alpha/beta-fold hydrolase